MRTITHTIAAAITMGAAIAAVTSGSAFAAERSNRDVYYALQRQHPDLFKECQTLATQRGFSHVRDETGSGRRRFVRECMQGKIPR
jgi:hypothetical protein